MPRIISALAGLPLIAALLLSGCANPDFIEPIEGRTFIVEERSRQAVWDAALSALAAEGEVERADFDAGELRGYYGVGLGSTGVMISMTQLYPGEDVYTVAVASRGLSPLDDGAEVREALIGDIQQRLDL